MFRSCCRHRAPVRVTDGLRNSLRRDHVPSTAETSNAQSLVSRRGAPPRPALPAIRSPARRCRHRLNAHRPRYATLDHDGQGGWGNPCYSRQREGPSADLTRTSSLSARVCNPDPEVLPTVWRSPTVHLHARYTSDSGQRPGPVTEAWLTLSSSHGREQDLQGTLG